MVRYHPVLHISKPTNISKIRINTKISVGPAEDEGRQVEGGGARSGEGLPEYPHTGEETAREGRDGCHQP